MKILKIALILLLPAIGIVGCKKSDLKPGCNSNHETESASSVSDRESNVTNTGSGESSTNRTMNTLSNTSPTSPGSVDIYGSGDDDRDGGDKGKKKVAR